MKVISVKYKTSSTEVKAIDCFVDSGYLQGPGGSLPDVDVDFQSDRRQEVKEYIERRYNHDGKQRVFSAGTFTTLKLKAVLKDVARVHRVPVNIVNYITAIFEDDNMSWTDLFTMAATNKKVHSFIMEYPQVIEDIRTLMGQPRSSSVHASALLVTPDSKDGKDLECFDFTPIKKVDGMLVSEFSGYDLDEQGLLKNDCLGIKELSKLQAVIDTCNKQYNTKLTFQSIVQSSLDDPKVYELLRNGYTQNVFQFSSKGMTKFLVSMKPEKIEDLIAANALFRPATLDSGSADKYVDCKLGDAAPVYLWGTYNILKETYGQMTYQEQLAQMSRKIGGFTLGEGVQLIKLISKKKIDKIKVLKDKFLDGALKKGCPKDDAIAIWDMIESGGSYLFNKCISGKESIRRINRTKGCLTIAEMYKTLNDSKWAESNGHKSLKKRYQRFGYGKGWSLAHTDGWDDYLIKNDIVDIRYMGIRSLYRITLESGASIDVTLNHKHPTNNGVKRTDELEIGVDKMYVNIGALKEDTVYRFTDKSVGQNDAYYHSNNNIQKYSINAEKGHCGFTKRNTSYTLLEKYRKEKMKSKCEICGDSKRRLEIHHKNGDHSDVGEHFSNLQTLCVSCHKKAHYKMGRVKQGEKGLYTRLETVISIEYIGEDEVYDVEMADPNHTFVTEKGVVTCNSHATAYAVTAYAGAYLKANYPTAFYTIALQWAKDDEIPTLMSEMELCSEAKIVPPDINVSGGTFITDYETNKIFWSLSRIKMLGAKATEWIINERNVRGEFSSIENFIERIFRYKLKQYKYWDDPDNPNEVTKCPVNARHVRHLILSGCFDKVENAQSVIERYAILEKAAKCLGFEISEKDIPEDLRNKHYFWSQQQIAISGIGAIDYKRIYDNSEAKPKIKGKASWALLKNIQDPDYDGKRVAICANIVDIEEKKFKDKKTGENRVFCKLLLQQNNDLVEMVIWNDEWMNVRATLCKGGSLSSAKNKMLICSAQVKYSDYTGGNNLQLYKSSIIDIL